MFKFPWLCRKGEARSMLGFLEYRYILPTALKKIWQRKGLRYWSLELEVTSFSFSSSVSQDVNELWKKEIKSEAQDKEGKTKFKINFGSTFELMSMGCISWLEFRWRVDCGHIYTFHYLLCPPVWPPFLSCLTGSGYTHICHQQKMGPGVIGNKENRT